MHAKAFPIIQKNEIPRKLLQSLWSAVLFYRVMFLELCISWGTAPSHHCSASWYRWLWELSFSSLDDFGCHLPWSFATGEGIDVPQGRVECQALLWGAVLWCSQLLLLWLCSLLNRARGNISPTSLCPCSSLFVPVCIQSSCSSVLPFVCVVTLVSVVTVVFVVALVSVVL